MTDELRNEAPEEAVKELREEVAILRQRVLRLESLLANGREASQPEAQRSPAMRAGAVAPVLAPAEPAPSMETTIGSQWLSRVGILAVLVGVALFLKLAIDNHWIGATARIALGLIGGVAVFAGSEPFRRKGYPAFSSTLKGIGAGILYLSLWASFSLYHQLPPTMAGLGMIVVTVGNGLLAWKQNSLVLAVYAMVGGMLTPFLISNAHHHEVALFAYLLLLSVGACVLALTRTQTQTWNSLLLLAFSGCALYAVAWAFLWYRAGELPVTVAFAAAGFLLFALVPFVPGSKPPRSESQTTLAVANAVGGIVLALVLYAGLTRALVLLGIAAFYYLLLGLRPNSQESPLASWTVALNGNAAVLVGVAALIHWLWQAGTSVGASGAGLYTGEQLSYSFWFMGFGALLVILGFWRRRAALRWQGLALLLASITKVFLIDMEFLSAGLRVFSFLGLGLLLLVVSFVYQRDWLKLRKG